MKVCLFGSSFNPPHIAHKQIVEGLKLQNFDKLIIVPTGKPNHKQIDVSDEMRIEMVKAFASECEVEYSLHEIENKFEYTYQSLEYLNFDQQTKIYFTIGGDSLNALESWDYFEKLKLMVTFVVVNRPGLELDENILNQISYQILDCQTTDVSSTALREHIEQDLIPDAVYRVIEKYNLYNT